jgi:hypothetical protein
MSKMRAIAKAPEFFARGYSESRFVTIMGLPDETISMIEELPQK